MGGIGREMMEKRKTGVKVEGEREGEEREKKEIREK